MNGQKYLRNTPDGRHETAEIIRQGLKEFENHTAKLLVDDENYAIINWQAGCNIEYSVRYVLDKQNGVLSISGDLGDAVLKWYGHQTIDRIASFCNDVYYFGGKLTACTDYKERRVHNMKKDLVDIQEKYHEEHGQDVQFDEDFFYWSLRIMDLEEWQIEHYPCGVPEYISSFSKEYRIPDEEVQGVGERVSPRVFLWALGFQMAVEQLNNAHLKEVV